MASVCGDQNDAAPLRNIENGMAKLPFTMRLGLDTVAGARRVVTAALADP
jgi:hypothetical protein